MTKFTKEQNQAINDYGKDILVSASAGSGKTTVLVERVLKRILSGTPVSSLLIITFTKAAAREMKERIKQKISDQIEKEPNNQFLRTQLLDVDTANISTIDSFCLDVIRRFYYVIDLDPQFSVLTDETQAELLKERALHEIEIEYLEKMIKIFRISMIIFLVIGMLKEREIFYCSCTIRQLLSLIMKNFSIIYLVLIKFKII